MSELTPDIAPLWVDGSMPTDAPSSLKWFNEEESVALIKHIAHHRLS